MNMGPDRTLSEIIMIDPKLQMKEKVQLEVSDDLSGRRVCRISTSNNFVLFFGPFKKITQPIGKVLSSLLNSGYRSNRQKAIRWEDRKGLTRYRTS